MKLPIVALLVLLAAPLRAQEGGGGARTVLTRAVRAYQDLDFDGAARLLRRVLSPPLVAQLDTTERARALIYLGAAEHYRGQPDSAIAVFRRLVALAPDQRPDTLTFPPEVTRLYDGVRSATTVAAAAIDTQSRPPPQNAPPPPPPPPPPPATEPRKRVADAGTVPQRTRVVANVAGLVSNVRTTSGAGVAAGFVGTVRSRRLELEVLYAEGSGAQDLVEGAIALRVKTTPWLSIQLGPQARNFATQFGNRERWFMWQFGARADVPLSPRVRGQALLWRGLGLDVNVPPGTGSAGGGAAGVTLDLGPRPFWVGLSYGIEQDRLRGGGRRESVHTLTLTAGVSRR